MKTNLSKERIIFRNSYQETKDINIALQKLKEMDCAIVDAVRVVKYELDISLREADEYVLNAPAWCDYKPSAMKIRQEFWNVLESSEDSFLE